MPLAVFHPIEVLASDFLLFLTVRFLLQIHELYGRFGDIAWQSITKQHKTKDAGGRRRHYGVTGDTIKHSHQNTA